MTRVLVGILRLLCAVGTYYLWRDAFGFGHDLGLLAAIVIWTPADPGGRTA